MSSPPLTQAERGRRGAAKRWADPASRKVARLDELTGPQRAVVLALIEAHKSANRAAKAPER